MVRRHRRRRVRALGHGAVRRPGTGTRGVDEPGARRRAGSGPAGRRGRLPGRPRHRPPARRRRHVHGRRHPHLAVGPDVRRARARRLRAPRGRRRRRALRRRDAAGDLPLRARRLAPPGGPGRPHRRRQRRRREVRRPGPRPHPARLRPGPRRPAAAAPARAPRPRGAADLGRRRRHRDRTRDRPARRARAPTSPPTRRALLVCAHPRGAHPAVPLRPRDRRADRPAHRAGLRGLGRRPPGRHGRVLLLVGRGAAERPRAAPRRHGPRADHPAGRSAAGIGAGRGRVGGRPGRAGARPRRPAGAADAARPPSSACTAARTPPTKTASPRVRALWVDAGFTVVEINYRGSTGYGSAWRDAIEGRPGLTELEDVAAVVDALVAEGIADPARTVVEGWSWGGYLALLAAGTQPAAVGRGAGRRPRGRLPRRLRRRDGAAARLRPGAVRRLPRAACPRCTGRRRR